jgi:hypothetical protein
LEIALLDEGPMFYVAAGCTIIIGTIELAMNLRHGTGWVFTAHLILIGPLWLLLTAHFLYAVARKVFCDGGKGVDA